MNRAGARPRISAWLLDRPVVAAFDRAVDRRFDALRALPTVDRVMYALSELGDFSLIWHTGSVAWGLFGGPQGERAMLRLSGALAVEAAVVNGPIKSAFGRSRPTLEATRTNTLRQPMTSSFPSGHASAAACAAILVADRRHPFTSLVVGALATAVSVSRVHVRIHHGSDIIGGAIMGATFALLVRRAVPLR